MNTSNKYLFLFPLLIGLYISQTINAQFYRGSYQEFGKNRLQFIEPNWQHQDYKDFNIYFYGTGRPLADFTADHSIKVLNKMQEVLDYRIHNKVFILVFNTQSEFQQSNIGLEATGGNELGGTTHLQGNKLFVYFNGSHDDFKRQIQRGLSEVVIRQMLFGNKWMELVRNASLLNVPDWYVNGLVSYAVEPWSIRIDDKLRDLVLQGKIESINRLNAKEAEFASHALWYYISEVYGTAVLPNILYMTKISRSMDDGFSYVLGISTEKLIVSAQKYFLEKYLIDDAQRTLPTNDPLKIKSKKRRTYQRVSLSSDAKYVAYTSNELGKYKVWLHNVETEKTKKLLKGNFKLERIPDVSYPLLSWSPISNILAIIYDKKGKVMLDLYDIDEKSWDHRELVRVDKVLGFNFSPDGMQLIISAIKNSQSDLFLFKLNQNSIRQITTDIYDDFTPSFIPNTNEIIFSSNRESDSVAVTKDISRIMPNHDIFSYNLKNKSKTFNRVIQSDEFDERLPYAINDKYFTFLSGNNGIQNRYIGRIDSSINNIDTAIHYRYFTDITPITNYKRNILYQSLSLNSLTFSQLIKYKGKYQFYIENLENAEPQISTPTHYKNSKKKRKKK